MKKKFFIAAAAVLCAGIVLFAGCSLDDFSGASADKRFPYDVAEERGEEGSHESWLASLEAPSTELRRLFDEAKEDGSFDGTYFEFLKEMGVKEDNGAYAQEALRSVVYVQAHFFPASRNAAEYYSIGSGIIYDLDTAAGDALIVTNYHVVFSADSVGNEAIAHVSDDISVFLYGSEIKTRAIEASYVGGTMEYDIAVLKVEGEEMLKNTAESKTIAKEVTACDSDSVTAGERVYAVGNADGEGVSVTAGVVSVEAEDAKFLASDDKTYITLSEIRFDAAVNPGNSGGGLFNASGELLGIVNGGREVEDVVGFGYAIPANTALAIAQNIIDTCAKSPEAHGAAQARLSVSVQVQDSRSVWDEETGKLYIEEKIVIYDITRGGAADKMGMLVGDTLISAKIISTRGGEREIAVTRDFKLTAFLFEVRLGDTVEFTVSRGGKTLTLSLVYATEDLFRLAD